MKKMINKYKLEMFLLVVGSVLTVLARQHAVAKRVSMGLDPSWGGEYFIIPLIIVGYFAIKADWGFN